MCLRHTLPCRRHPASAPGRPRTHAGGPHPVVRAAAPQVLCVDFNPSYQLLASAGGTVNTVWSFEGDGPAGSMPTVALGHAKPITCQVWM